MDELINNAEQKDKERNIGIFNLIIVNDLLFILCNN
jgi:hypothetical protein